MSCNSTIDRVDGGAVVTGFKPGIRQVSVVTFADIEVNNGYTYTVKINGETYSVTAGKNDTADNLAFVLNGLKAKIDADFEDHGLTVKVEAVECATKGGGVYALTIIGKDDGSAFEINDVSVTKSVEVADAVAVNSEDVNGHQETTVTFNASVPPKEGYTYTVTIDGVDYGFTFGSGDSLYLKLGELQGELYVALSAADFTFLVDTDMDGNELLVINAPGEFSIAVSVTKPEGVEKALRENAVHTRFLAAA